MSSNSSRTAVSAELGLGLVGPEQTIVPLMASLSYSCQDPYAVKIAFHIGTDEPVEWTLARDLLTFLGCWFAAAFVLRLYAHPSRTRLLATWLLGITAAVLIRAAIVGHWAGDFYGVALGFTLLFVLAARAFLIKSNARRAD